MFKVISVAAMHGDFFYPEKCVNLSGLASVIYAELVECQAAFVEARLTIKTLKFSN